MMTESVLKSILEEYAEEEWAKYADVPEHVFSRKHNRSMKRIFRLYDKNTSQFRNYFVPSPMPKIKYTPKKLMLILLIVFLAVLAGCSANYFISQSFRGEVYSDNTKLFPVNLENCPAKIEEKYYLTDIPEEYEVLQTTSSPFDECICYIDNKTGKIIAFSQYVKDEFLSFHLNTEKGELVEIDINGHKGILLDLGNEEQYDACLIWDNGDYILEIEGNLAKEELLNLAKTTEIYQNKE